MDYANRRRLKIFGRARIVEAKTDAALINSLRVSGYEPKVKRAMLIDVAAFDWKLLASHYPRA